MDIDPGSWITVRERFPPSGLAVMSLIDEIIPDYCAIGDDAAQ